MSRPPSVSGYCEWDPKANGPALSGSGCENQATLSVGGDKNWHLCDDCAALPVFKRLRRRKPLRRNSNG